MRALPSIILLTAFNGSWGQWNVPVKVVLDGTEATERQVTGLAAPLSTDAAVSLDAARTLATTYTTVSGSYILTGDLVPAPDGYSTGMLVTIHPDSANAAGAELDLNTIGPTPIHRQDGLPVQASDLLPGVPARLIYTGEVFQLLSSTPLPCPSGTIPTSARSCIEENASAANNFYQAIRRCRNAGGRLCSFTEWMAACQSIPGFLDTVGPAEWLDHAANHVGNAKTIGYGTDGTSSVFEHGCDRGFHHDPWETTMNSRCCFSR